MNLVALAPETAAEVDFFVQRQFAARIAAAIVATVALVVLAGWIFGIGQLRTFIAGYAPMNPVTAICLLLCAAALLRLTRDNGDLVGLAMAAIVCTAALLRLSDYLVHSQFRIDQRLFSSSLALDVPSAPNQIAPNTAFCLLMAGLSMLTFSPTPWRSSARRCLCLLNIAVSWFAIVGYLLSSTPLYRVGVFTPMALHAAVCLLILGFVTLVVAPQERLLSILFGDSIGSLVVRVTVPMAFAVPLSVVYLSQLGRHAGIFGPGLGSAMTASLITATTLAVLMPMANTIHRLDIERRKYQRVLESHVGMLTDLAAIDGLTGVFNRRSFDHVLRGHQERSRATGHTLALVMIDLDNFKRHNDEFGHRSGDEVLKRVAETMKQNLRSDDAAARYGGDEFAIILPRSSAETAAVVAERIRSSLAEDESVLKGVTASVGVVAVGPEFSGDIVEAADQCLYRAKTQGKNKVVVS
jgi:diguanylate cyclase (GGDEF)-like protein